MQITKKRTFIQLSTVLPEMVGNKFKIKHYKIPVFDVFKKMRNSMSENSHVSLEHLIDHNFTYTKLSDKNGVWMSDTPMETVSNQNFINKANGDVLIFGLGIGLIVFPLLNCDEIKSITIIEREKEIIDMVGQHLKSDKVTIILGDADTMEFAKGTKFDTIYFDIWQDISSENYEHMQTLHKRYRKNLNTKNPNRFIDSWLRNHVKRKYLKYKREDKKWGCLATHLY